MVATPGTQPARPQRVKTLLLAALLSLSLIAGVAGSTTTQAAYPLPGERLVCEIRQGTIVCYFK
jgi:hypothetical protein